MDITKCDGCKNATNDKYYISDRVYCEKCWLVVVSNELARLKHYREKTPVVVDKGDYHCPRCNAWFCGVKRERIVTQKQYGAINCILDKGDNTTIEKGYLIGTTPYCGNCGQCLDWSELQ